MSPPASVPPFLGEGVVLSISFKYSWARELVRTTFILALKSGGRNVTWFFFGALLPPQLGDGGQPSLQCRLHDWRVPPPEAFEKALTGKLFASDTDVKQAVISWLQTNETDCCYDGIYAMVSGWDKCLNVIGGCVEVWCVPSATRVMYISKSQ